MEHCPRLCPYPVLVALLAVLACGDSPMEPVEVPPREVAGTWEGIHVVGSFVWVPRVTLYHEDETNVAGNWALTFQGSPRLMAYGPVEGSFNDPEIEFRSEPFRVENRYEDPFDIWLEYTGQAVAGEDDPRIIRGRVTYYYDLLDGVPPTEYVHEMSLYREN